jgi:hypothetical protein
MQRYGEFASVRSHPFSFDLESLGNELSQFSLWELLYFLTGCLGVFVVADGGIQIHVNSHRV